MFRTLLFIITILVAAPVRSAQLIVSLNPEERLSAGSPLRDTALLGRDFQRVTVVLPARRRADSTRLLARYPFLRSPVFRIEWSERLIPASLRSGRSTVYQFGRGGALLKSVPLSDFSPADFAGGPLPGTIAAIDTIRTGNRMPESVSSLTVAGGRLYLIDNQTGQLVFLDRRNGDTLWNALSFAALAPSAYQRYLNLSDSEALRRVQEYDSVFRVESFGTLAGVVAVGHRADTLLVTVNHNYPTELFLNGFKDVYEVVEDQVVGSALLVDPAAVYSDSVQQAATALYRGRVDGTDSLAGFAQLEEYLNTAAAGYRERFPQQYSPLSQVFRNDSGAYLLTSLQNADSYRFIGRFQKHGRRLLPAGRMLRVEKGAIYQEAQNFRHFSNLTGSYPYVMHAISNVLYDLRLDRQTLLPLPLGDHDIGPAAMQQLRPRTELSVFDVLVEDGVARVLYVAKERSSLRLLVYDLSRGLTLSDRELPELRLEGRCLLKFADAGSFFVTRADDGILQLVSLN